MANPILKRFYAGLITDTATVVFTATTRSIVREMDASCSKVSGAGDLAWVMLNSLTGNRIWQFDVNTTTPAQWTGGFILEAGDYLAVDKSTYGGVGGDPAVTIAIHGAVNLPAG